MISNLAQGFKAPQKVFLITSRPVHLKPSNPVNPTLKYGDSLLRSLTLPRARQAIEARLDEHLVCGAGVGQGEALA